MNEKSLNKLRQYNNLVSEINASYHDLSFKLSMSDSAMQVLYSICIYGDSCPLNNICKDSGLSKQTVNSAVRKLESNGFVRMEPINAKTKQVCLTDDGRRLAEKTALIIIGIENDIFSEWQEEEVEKYLMLTKRYLNDFRKKASAV